MNEPMLNVPMTYDEAVIVCCVIALQLTHRPDSIGDAHDDIRLDRVAQRIRAEMKRWSG